MSDEIRIVCESHSPNLWSPSGDLRSRDLAKVKKVVEDREDWRGLLLSANHLGVSIDYDTPAQRLAVLFVRDHPTCALTIRDQAGRVVE